MSESAETVARDNAQTAVLDNAGVEWRQQVRDYIKGIAPGTELRGEQVRTLCLDRGIKPHHHNAWGAMIKTLVKEGYLEVIDGKFEAMQAKGSHARKTQVYRTKPSVLAAAA
jgi:hypothetical protein